ncbi:MAG: hypothetical protein LHW60_06695 [Candidatus Cloacimonetes bacterium]|jgi:hypothetical protein|nr:hypothetical protein [Candidatus Cloacimonadota bacterium]
MKALDLKTVPINIVFIDHQLKNDMAKSARMFLQNFIEGCWNSNQRLRLNTTSNRSSS